MPIEAASSHFIGYRHSRAPFCSRLLVLCFSYSPCLETGLLALFATKLTLRRRFKVPSPVCASGFPPVICRHQDTLFDTGECFETSDDLTKV